MTMSFMAFFLPMNIPAVIALDRFGLRVGILIGIFGTCIGLWIRVWINQSFTSVIVGQTVISIA